MEETYNEIIKKLGSEKIKYKKWNNILSFLRLIAFFIALGCTYFLIVNTFSVFSLMSVILSYILFIYLLIQYNNLDLKIKRTDYMIEINEKYIHRIEGKWIEFEDNGEEYLNVKHPYSSDLDIFGAKSLFQLINTTNTFIGRQKLVKYLENPLKDIKEIVKRQNAVKELGHKNGFCEELECEGMWSKKSKENPGKLFEYAENKNKLFKSELIKYMVFLLPIIFIGSTFVIFFNKLWSIFFIVLLLFTIHLGLYAFAFMKITPVLNLVYSFKNDIEAYVNILELIEKQEFKDEYLNELKTALFSEKKSVLKSVKELNKIVENISLRYNMAFTPISIILMWDYQCLFSLEKWKKDYGNDIRQWIETIGEFESLSSLSVLCKLNPNWTFPSFYEEKCIISAKEMGHPLIDSEKRICNDVDMTNSIFIITGSNMSGKTTFLRTIGINLVLSYAGAPVCAENFDCTIMDIFTSMRIEDDLNEGISTFYAELLRIKIIIEELNKKEPMIFLIDEIFRGTNSNDRIIGAKNVLKNLNKEWVIGGISTHDFELCDLEFDDKVRIKNYHFRESYTNNNIIFDYKLKRGRSNTTNAKYLMRMVGIEIEP